MCSLNDGTVGGDIIIPMVTNYFMNEERRKMKKRKKKDRVFEYFEYFIGRIK